MSLIIVKNNESIPLFAKLGKAETDKYVRAYLRDANGAPYSTPSVDLSHAGEGLYVDNSVIFSGALPLIASYQVFNDSGYSEKADIYDDADIVIPVDFGEVVRKDAIIGVMVNDAITGVLKGGSITGVFHEEYFNAIFKDDKAVGVVPSDVIEGVFKTC